MKGVFSMENILHYKYEFRNIRADEIEQAVAIEINDRDNKGCAGSVPGGH